MESEGYTFPFQGQWDNDQNGEVEDFDMYTYSYTFSDLPADDYEINIQLSDDCSIFAAFAIPEVEMRVEAFTQDAGCGQVDGGIQLVVFRDNIQQDENTFEVVWQDLPEFDGTVRGGLSDGYYCATIISSETPACIAEKCVTLQPAAITIEKEDSECGMSTGSVSIILDPSINPASIRWSDDEGYMSGTDGQTELLNLPPGDYCYEIYSGDCNRMECIEVQGTLSEESIDFTVYEYRPYNTHGGGASVASKSDDIINVQWRDHNEDIVQEAIGVREDNLLHRSVGEQYCVYVETDQGCTWEHCFTVTGANCLESFNIYVDEIIQPSGPFAQDGSVSVHVSGQTRECQSDNYQYEWFNGTNGPLNGFLDPGEYCVTISAPNNPDCNTCIKTACFTLQVPAENCSELTSVTPSVYPPKCTDPEGAIIFRSAPRAGSGEHYYTWSDDQGNRYYPESLLSLSFIPPGIYYLDVIDPAGCSHRIEIQVRPELVNIEEDITPSCDDLLNGSISLNFLEGIFDVYWDNGEVDLDNSYAEITGLGPGTYCADIRATDGTCDYRECFDVPGVTAQDLSLEVLRSQFCNSRGYIEFNILNGVGPYEVVWSHSPNTYTYENVFVRRATPSQGQYCVSVTDNCGSVLNQCFDVEGIDVHFTPHPACQNNGTLDINITNAFLPYRVKLNNGGWVTYNEEADITLTNLSSRDVCVEVHDRFGCRYRKCYYFENRDYQILNVESSCPNFNNGSLSIRVNNPLDEEVVF